MNEVIWSNEENLGRADKTLQVALVERKPYYVLNFGDGYESIFDSIIEVSNYLNGKDFKRIATIEAAKTDEYLRSL